MIYLRSGDDALTMSPDDVTVVTKIHNSSFFDIEMTFEKLDVKCSTQLLAVKFRILKVEPPTQHVLSCEMQPSSGKVTCSGKISTGRMSLCEAYQLTFLPVYKDNSFSLLAQWSASKTLEPLLNQMERVVEARPQTELFSSRDQQLVRLEWNDPVCWSEPGFESWELQIQTTGSPESLIHKGRWPSECSSGSHLPSSKSATFKHRLELQNGHILACNYSRSILDSHESDFIFSPCSSYWLHLIPVDRNSELLQEYSQSTLFNLPISITLPEHLYSFTIIISCHISLWIQVKSARE